MILSAGLQCRDLSMGNGLGGSNSYVTHGVPLKSTDTTTYADKICDDQVSCASSRIFRSMPDSRS
jgi:hypothetical protein